MDLEQQINVLWGANWGRRDRQTIAESRYITTSNRRQSARVVTSNYRRIALYHYANFNRRYPCYCQGDRGCMMNEIGGMK